VPTVIGQKQAGSDLNLRAAATADSTILTVIPAGSTLDLVGPAENGRLPVLWQGQTGWVAEAYVIEVGAALPTPEAPPASIGQRYATDSLNVRTQPNTSAQVVGVLTRGQAIDITNQTDGNWQQVLYNGAVRWVSRDYLAAEPPRTAAAAQIAVDFAISKLGGPYVWGGNGPTGYDCSGLVRSAYQAAGISLPRVASAQATYGVPVSRQNIAVGDLVFYYSPISHVAIYVGNGQVVHASTYGVGIIRSDVDMATITAIRRMA
jgi:cell wall-associated NlpC family hydrolase